ncbi:hypothetical protein ACJMK2_011287, partial [Sinanodonta woodiana]
FGCECNKKLLQCLHRVQKSDTIAESDKQTAIGFEKLHFKHVHPYCVLEDHPITCTGYKSYK